jgi:hypothetical protein
MKIYKLTELKTLAKSGGYKMASLEDSQGKRMLPFNRLNVRLDTQFSNIDQKLRNELTPDGVYYVVLATSIAAAKNPDRYPVSKGKLTPDQVQNAQNTPIVIHTPVSKSEEMLSMGAALEYIQENANLKAQNAILQARVSELELQLEEFEGMEEGDKEQPGWEKFLQEQGPVFLGLADKFLEQRERKISLEEKKFAQQPKVPEGYKKMTKSTGSQMKVGSREHLDLIEKLYNEDKEEEMNTELDKLEAANVDLYNKVITALGLVDEEEEEEEEEQQ